VAFEPPVLSEVYSFESLSLLNEVSATAFVLDYSAGQGPKVVWANSTARELYNGRSLGEMLELDVSWQAHNSSENFDDDRLKIEVGVKVQGSASVKVQGSASRGQDSDTWARCVRATGSHAVLAHGECPRAPDEGAHSISEASTRCSRATRC